MTDVAGRGDGASAVAVAPDRRLLVAGTTEDPSPYDTNVLVARCRL